MAKDLEADATYIIKSETGEKENLTNIQKLFGAEPDVTIDASGVESTIRLAILVSTCYILIIYKVKCPFSDHQILTMPHSSKNFILLFHFCGAPATMSPSFSQIVSSILSSFSCKCFIFWAGSCVVR